MDGGGDEAAESAFWSAVATAVAAETIAGSQALMVAVSKAPADSLLVGFSDDSDRGSDCRG